MLFKRGRRRSDRFAEMLDESTGRRRRHRRSELDVELSPLIATAAEVSAAGVAPAPTDEFKAGLRAMLMATAEREGIGVTADEKAAQAASRAAMSAKTAVVKQIRTHSSSRARAAVIVGVMAGALLLSGVSAASTNALPGNPLYQVKRTNERAQLALAGSDAGRGRLYLDFAAGRLHEARQVSSDWTARVFSDMNDETVAGVNLLIGAATGGDRDALDVIRAFLDAQRPQLAGISVAVPSATDLVRTSMNLLDEVTARVAAIAKAIDRHCLYADPDKLGPVPAASC
jgi:Domain of unknown function (DUF5667)